MHYKSMRFVLYTSICVLACTYLHELTMSYAIHIYKSISTFIVGNIRFVISSSLLLMVGAACGVVGIKMVARRGDGVKATPPPATPPPTLTHQSINHQGVTPGKQKGLKTHALKLASILRSICSRILPGHFSSNPPFLSTLSNVVILSDEMKVENSAKILEIENASKNQPAVISEAGRVEKRVGSLKLALEMMYPGCTVEDHNGRFWILPRAPMVGLSPAGGSDTFSPPVGPASVAPEAPARRFYSILLLDNRLNPMGYVLTSSQEDAKAMGKILTRVTGLSWRHDDRTTQ